MEDALAVDRPFEVRPLDGSERVDIAVVGGGYTGLWTALNAKERDPAVSVMILEADLCGSGASGRNGGFAFGWWPKIEVLIDRVGREEALWLAREADDAVLELGRLTEQEGINAEYRQGGWIWSATSPAQDAAWSGAVKTAESLGEQPFREMSETEVQEVTGSTAHLGAVFADVAATVHPAKLSRGLAELAVRRGIEVRERTPVLEIDRSTGTLKTAQGDVRASTIVLATNAWLAGIPELRRAIVPLSSDVVATEPMAEDLRASGWTGGESISDSRLLVNYYRTTEDGRVVFGKGGGALGGFGRIPGGFDFSEALVRNTEESLRKLVPASEGVPTTKGWGGAVDRSSDGLPIFGNLGGGGPTPILYGAGFSGNGVVPSMLAGRILAARALGLDDEWSNSGLARGIPGKFPPEPFRSVGGVLVRESVRRKETAEDAGRSTDPVTAKLASLAPSGFFKPSEKED